MPTLSETELLLKTQHVQDFGAASGSRTPTLDLLTLGNLAISAGTVARVAGKLGFAARVGTGYGRMQADGTALGRFAATGTSWMCWGYRMPDTTPSGTQVVSDKFPEWKQDHEAREIVYLWTQDGINANFHAIHTGVTPATGDWVMVYAECTQGVGGGNGSVTVRVNNGPAFTRTDTTGIWHSGSQLLTLGNAGGPTIDFDFFLQGTGSLGDDARAGLFARGAWLAYPFAGALAMPVPTTVPDLVTGLPCAAWWYAPNGLSGNDGTESSPWSAAAAYQGGPSGAEILPGHRVRRMAGTYYPMNGYLVTFPGDANQPVIWEPAENGICLIEGDPDLNGGVVYPTFEFLEPAHGHTWRQTGLSERHTNGNSDRSTADPAASTPTSAGGHYQGVKANAADITVYNSITNNLGNGLNVDPVSGVRFRAYCPISNFNGWFGPKAPAGRGNGFGMYGENTQGDLRQMIGGLFIGNGQDAFKWWSQNGPCGNVVADDNFGWANGLPYALFWGLKTAGAMIFSGAGLPDVVVGPVSICRNLGYLPDGYVGGGLGVGQVEASDHDVHVDDNLIVASVGPGFRNVSANGTSLRNKWIIRKGTIESDGQKLVTVVTASGAKPGAELDVDDNEYWNLNFPLQDGKRYVCQVSGCVNDVGTLVLTIPQYLAQSGLDQHSTFYPDNTLPTLQYVKLLRNPLVAGRARIGVLNLPKLPSVPIDLSDSGLVRGQPWRLFNHDNLLDTFDADTPCASGTYDPDHPIVTVSMQTTVRGGPHNPVVTGFVGFTADNLGNPLALFSTASQDAGPGTGGEALFLELLPGTIPVVALLTASVTAGAGPLRVPFVRGSTGPITSTSLNYGDGSPVTDTVAAHTYTAPGTYTAVLSESDGVTIHTSSVVVRVGARPIGGVTAAKPPKPKTAAVAKFSRTQAKPKH